jgi:transposase
VRVTTAVKRLLCLSGITVSGVEFGKSTVVVTVQLTSRKLQCPLCLFMTKAAYDRRPVSSVWRHLDLAAWRLEIRSDLRRLECPTHGVRTQGVPFARAGSRFTRDFEDLVGWLATTMDKTALRRLMRIDWDTTGRIIERVIETGLDPKRLDDLFVIGVDEVSWRKGHSYLTMVSNNATGKFVWGQQGKDTATLDCVFTELGKERSEAIEAVSMDLGPAFDKSARKPGHATNAIICYDPFHVVQLATKALEKVRRQVWQELRQLPDKDVARRFKGARWALLKNPEDLGDEQAVTLRQLKRKAGQLWRAYALKEALRAVFAGDLSEDEVGLLSGPVLLEGLPQRLEALRHDGPDTPETTVRDPRCGQARDQQCPPRRTESASPADHQPGLRLPLRQRRPGPHHDHPRTSRTRPTARTDVGREPLNRPTFMPGGPQKCSTRPEVYVRLMTLRTTDSHWANRARAMLDMVDPLALVPMRDDLTAPNGLTRGQPR